MWEPNKKSKVKTMILIVIVISFVPFSYLWYETLSHLGCTQISLQTNVNGENLKDTPSNCISQTSSHWLMFYAINGMMYGVPFTTLVLKTKRV
ncbi:MAG: hypothetical protein KGI28_01255 [Thaumarchaeota archaeon]|nr:hypothetical protein [Nitrososphaerota archaeon]